MLNQVPRASEMQLSARMLVIALILALVPVPGCLRRPSRSTSDLNGLGFMPPEPPQTPMALAKLFEDEFPEYFDAGLLTKKAVSFSQEASYLGDQEQIQTMALSMMQQWLYLAMYKRTRSEYLMVSYVQALAVSGLAPEAALAKFDQKVPESLIALHPDLRAKRLELRAGLDKLLKDKTARENSRDLLKGTLEGAYLSLKVLDTRLRFLKERFAESDERFVREKQEIDGFSAMIRNSHSLLATKPFTSNVQPFYPEETTQTSQLKEAAVNSFNKKFAEHMKEHRSLDSLADYISGDEIQKLGKDLANALQIDIQIRFRQRIADNFNAGVAETISYLDETLDDHRNNYVGYDDYTQVIAANTKPNSNTVAFKKWLIDVFKEQAVHFVIASDYPYLQAGATPLTEFVTGELSRQSTNRTWRYAGIVIATSLSGLGTSNGLGWLGKWPTRLAQIGIFGAQAGLTASFIYDSVAKYHEWRNMHRLARVNVQGVGLATLIQEDAAWKSMWASFAVSGLTAGMTLLTANRFYSGGRVKDPKTDGLIRDTAKATWQGNPVALKDWASSIRNTTKSLATSVKAGDLAAANRHIGSITVDFAAIATQMMVSIPASLPEALKSTLIKIPPQVYNGVVMGTVMGVMGVTVQHITNAQGIRMFTYAFEKLGFSVPAFWKSNGLNEDFRINRDAYLMLDSELMDARSRVVNIAIAISNLEKALAEPGMTEPKKAEIRALIAEQEGTAQNVLRIQLSRWYKRVEFRDIANSMMKYYGFGLSVTPSFESPNRMTILLRTGSKNYSYSTTAAQIDSLIDRKVIPDPAISKADLDALIQVTQPDAQQPPSSEGASVPSNPNLTEPNK